MKISLAIPTYDRLSYLKEVVDSCLAQTYSDYEIVIALDPTPKGLDESIMIWGKGLSDSNSKVRFYYNERNLGLAGNWNRLVDLAEGEYIIILGDDDLLMPTFLEEVYSHILSWKSDVIFSSQKFIDSHGNILFDKTFELNKSYGRDTLQEGLIDDPLAVVLKNSVPMSASVIKKSWLFKYPFDETLNTPEFEVFLKIALAPGLFSYVNKELASYRMHQGSATSSGLTVHKLLRNVIDIDVPVSHEPLKKRFVERILPVAINRSLREGNRELARKFLLSKYYPKEQFHKRLIQCFLCVLPNLIVRRVLR